MAKKIKNKFASIFLLGTLLTIIFTLINNIFLTGVQASYSNILTSIFEVGFFMFLSFFIIQLFKTKKENKKLFNLALIFGIFTSIFTMIAFGTNLNFQIILLIVLFRFLSPLVALFISK